MNPVTFNDKIKELITRYYMKAAVNTKTALDKLDQLFPHWETSPLFLYEEPSSEAETTAIVKAYDSDVFEVLPFPVFRLDITVSHTDHKEYGRYKAKALVGWYEDGPCVFGRIDDLLHTALTYPNRKKLESAEDKALPLMILVSGVKQTSPGSSDFFCNPSLIFGAGMQVWSSDESNGPEPWISTYINGLLKSLAAFNLSAMSPNNHIVEVRPALNGTPRSVQWVQARTHFTLITHGHPANNPNVQTGSRVSSDSCHELTRMAHNRRAHQRTLHSARFTYARGKTIKVRATWVGPKEWKDKGGRQIYKILEPVK